MDSSTRANPSSSAALATAIATAADAVRNTVIGGNKLAPGCPRIRQRRHRIRRRRDHPVADPRRPRHRHPQPQPREHQRIVRLRDLIRHTLVHAPARTGYPVAVNTFPSVHSIRSLGNASALLVGFDNGKMIGRST